MRRGFHFRRRRQHYPPPSLRCRQVSFSDLSMALTIFTKRFTLGEAVTLGVITSETIVLSVFGLILIAKKTSIATNNNIIQCLIHLVKEPLVLLLLLARKN